MKPGDIVVLCELTTLHTEDKLCSVPVARFGAGTIGIIVKVGFPTDPSACVCFFTGRHVGWCLIASSEVQGPAIAR